MDVIINCYVGEGVRFNKGSGVFLLHYSALIFSTGWFVHCNFSSGLFLFFFFFEMEIGGEEDKCVIC